VRVCVPLLLLTNKYMKVSFNDIVAIQTYDRHLYTDIIGDARDPQGPNPCYMTLGMERKNRMYYFYIRFIIRKYFQTWRQLKETTLIDNDDCSD